jgi:tripartite-type tricarboxylate transporter receptor subunit TctC
VLTRADTPAAVVVALNESLNRILRLDDVRTRLTALDAEPAGGSSSEFAAFLLAERVKWGAVNREAGVKSE